MDDRNTLAIDGRSMRLNGHVFRCRIPCLLASGAFERHIGSRSGCLRFRGGLASAMALGQVLQDVDALCKHLLLRLARCVQVALEGAREHLELRQREAPHQPEALHTAPKCVPRLSAIVLEWQEGSGEEAGAAAAMPRDRSTAA